MSAWDILTSNSSINSGNAWQHLNNQNIGTGIVVNTGATCFIKNTSASISIPASLRISVASSSVSTLVRSNNINVSILPGIRVLISTKTIIV